MEQRKLIRLGNSSFAIALPKDWVDKSGLKKGDNIFLEKNNNGEIVVSPKFKDKENKEITINIEQKDESELWKEISSAYINGYDMFYLKNKGYKESSNAIKSIISNFISLEIVENNEKDMTIKDFFSIKDLKQENFVRRIDNNITEMFELLEKGINSKTITETQIREIAEADKDINKIYLLFSRILSIGIDNPSIHSVLKTNGKSLFNSWWFAFNLEKIGDGLKSISKSLKNVKISEKDYVTIKRLISSTKGVYKASIESFYKNDKALAIKNSFEGKRIWEECDKIIESQDSNIIRIAMKIKEIEVSVYQNFKMVLYA